MCLKNTKKYFLSFCLPASLFIPFFIRIILKVKLFAVCTSVLDGLHGFSVYLCGIALGYGLNNLRFESRHGLGIFLFTIASRGAHPASYPMGTRRSSPGVKRPGIENHSPPCSAEVKNA
jgi:hypothetical protein